MAALVGILFGLPSLRIKGFYLAVATLAAQFFIEWALTKFGWFTNYSSSGVISAPEMQVFGIVIDSAAKKYLFTLAIVALLTLAAKIWCAARWAAAGWRCATWTWPPK